MLQQPIGTLREVWLSRESILKHILGEYIEISHPNRSWQMLRTPPLLRGEHKRKIWFRFYLMERIIRNSWELARVGWFLRLWNVFENWYTPCRCCDCSKEKKQPQDMNGKCKNAILKTYACIYLENNQNIVRRHTFRNVWDAAAYNFFQNNTNVKTLVSEDQLKHLPSGARTRHN